MTFGILTSLFSTYIGKIVLIQAALLAGGVTTTIGLLLFRNLIKRQTENKINFYTENIIHILLEKNDKPIKLWPWERAIYRDVLLGQIHILAGHERDLMINHYVSMSFFNDDVFQTKSRDWSKRLTALIRLDTLSIIKAREVFIKALNDSHPLVVLAATRALSRLAKENLIQFDPNLLFKSLEQVGLERRTALIEVIANIGSHCGPEVICEYLQSCKNPDMAIACIHVLGELRALQAMPIFLHALNYPEQFSKSYLAKVLDAVPLIGDPEAIVPIRNLLSHESAKVRARAVMALHLLGDDQFYSQMQVLKSVETDVEVQRAIDKVEKKAV